MCCVYIHVPTQSSITPKRSTPVNPIPLLYLNMRAPLSSLSAVLSTCVCVSQERMRRHQASIISVDMGPLGNSHRTEPAVVATRPFMTTPWSHEGFYNWTPLQNAGVMQVEHWVHLQPRWSAKRFANGYIPPRNAHTADGKAELKGFALDSNYTDTLYVELYVW